MELVQLEEARSREELELIRVEKGKKQKKTDVINEHKTDVMENIKKEMDVMKEAESKEVLKKADSKEELEMGRVEKVKKQERLDKNKIGVWPKFAFCKNLLFARMCVLPKLALSQN